jgi:hypothetical protein
MKLDKLKILEDEFDVFTKLPDKHKVQFLYDAMHIGAEASIVKQLNMLIDKDMLGHIDDDEDDHHGVVSIQEYDFGDYQLSAMMTPSSIYLNATGIKPIRKFTQKLFNDGLLLKRIPIKKSEYDMYRYFRAYEIIGNWEPLCIN